MTDDERVTVIRRKRFRQIHVGGLGSGNYLHYKRRQQVEQSWILDADDIPRPVEADAEGVLTITSPITRGVVTVEYLVLADDSGFELDVWTPVAEHLNISRIRLDQQRLPFGGARTYLLCPGVGDAGPCGRRATKLYWPRVGIPGYACRNCHRLAYRSSQKRPISLEMLRRHLDRARRPFKPLPSLKAVERRLERLHFAVEGQRTVDTAGSTRRMGP